MASRLAGVMLKSFKVNKDRTLVTYKSNFFYHRYTYSDILGYARRLITIFKKNGLKKGDKIIICIPNCPQYFYSFIASLLYGTVIVPLDFHSSADFIRKIKQETDAKLIITSKFKLFDSGLGCFFSEDLDDLLMQEEKSSPHHDTSDDGLLEILYTSGTTSEPKGVMLTHKNIYSNATSVLLDVNLKKDYRYLSIIPLSHSFEQIAGLFAVILTGAQTVHLQKMTSSEILKALIKEKITMIIAVPAFFDMLKNGIIAKAKEQGKEKLLDSMLNIGKNMPFAIRKLLFFSVHKQLGNHLKIIASGGAALKEETNVFWEAIGVKTLQGYGLTESSPVISINRENNRKIGSAGQPIRGVSVKIAEDGEILAKGDNITQGYYHNKKETDKILENGWLKTGDIGMIDSEGFLFIKGRKKNMILKSSGLNVYPEDIEKVLNTIKGIRSSCVIGRESGSDMVTCAVIIPDESLSKDKYVEKKIQEIIRKANSRLERHQTIQEHVIWDKEDFPKTHTLKIKRNLVRESITKKKGDALTDEKEDRLKSILSSISQVNQKKIDEDSNLYDDLKFDSIKVIELANLIEDRMKIEIDESIITKETAVKDLRKILETNKKTIRLKLSKKYYSKVWIPVRIIAQNLAYAFISYFCRVKIYGKNNLKGINKQIIVIFNHESYFDAPIIVQHLPMKIRMSIAAAAAADHFFTKNKRKNKRQIVSRLLQLYAPTYPMSRDNEAKNRTSIKQSMEFTGEVIDMGYSLLISPEGTRTTTGNIQPFKRGIGLFVKESRLDVLPVKLEGLYDIWPKGNKLPKRGNVTVKFGKIMDIKNSNSISKITDLLEKTIREM